MISDLPIGMQIAGKTTELDNVKVVRTKEPTGIRKRIYVLKTSGWEDRLISKSVKFINNDIKIAILKNSQHPIYSANGVKPLFLVYTLGDISESMYFAVNKLQYFIV
jgi:hypothetical protein